MRVCVVGIVESAVVSDGSDRRTLHSGLDYITGLGVWARGGGGGSAGAQCATDNGGCAHLCLAASTHPPDFRCACPAHYTLNKDNVTCAGKSLHTVYYNVGAQGLLDDNSCLNTCNRSDFPPTP